MPDLHDILLGFAEPPAIHFPLGGSAWPVFQLNGGRYRKMVRFDGVTMDGVLENLPVCSASLPSKDVNLIQPSKGPHTIHAQVVPRK